MTDLERVYRDGFVAAVEWLRCYSPEIRQDIRAGKATHNGVTDEYRNDLSAIVRAIHELPATHQERLKK